MLSESLYMTGGSVSKILDNYVKQGKAITEIELKICVEQLRRNLRFQHALQIIEWMERKKINIYRSNYAVILDLVWKTKGLVAAENFFSGLPLPAKNKYTYGALLNCYCKELMKDKALNHFEKMDELGYVTSLAFSNLMNLYMRSGEPQKVPHLVELMNRRSLPLCSVTYQLWMNSCASSGDLDGVERIYEEMKKTEDQIDWQTYSNLAAIYVKVKDFEKAEMMLKELEKQAKPGQRDAYHCLLGLYARTGNLEEVHRVWNSLKSVSPVTNLSYLVMLCTLRRLNDIEGLTKCFNEWEASCVSYDVRLAGVCVSAYLGHNMVEEAALVFEGASRKSKRPLFKIEEMFMLYFLEKRQLDDAVRYLEAALSEEVNGHKWHPPRQVVVAFLKCYEEETDMDGADELCKILKAKNFDDSRIKTLLIRPKQIVGNL